MARATPTLDPGTDDEPTLQDTAGTRDDYRGREHTGNGEPTDRLTELLEQYSPESGYRVYVERLDPLNGSEYLGMVPFDEQLLDCVRSKWGGGRFGGKIVDNRSKYVARVPPFRIGGRAIEPTTDAGPAAAPSSSSSESHIAAIIATSLAGFRDAIIDAIRPQQPPAVDPLQQLQSLASVIKDLQPPPQPQSSFDPQSMFETMTSMLDLRDRIRGSGDSGSGVGEAIREFAPLLRGVLDREAAPPPPPDQQPPADTVKLPRASTQKPAAAEWLQPFMRWKSMLLSIADQRKDPALYSDVLVDNLSDEQATAIATADATDGQLEIDLFTAVPELNHSDERRIFAGKLLAELRHGLYGESGAPAKKKKTRKTKPVATAAGGAA